MIMIYFLEQNQKYFDKILEHFDGSEKIIISSFLYAEILTGYYKNKEYDFVESFLAFNQASEKIKICPFNLETAKKIAELRAKFPSLKSPDCIHLSTAITNQADIFLTNDYKLQKFAEDISIKTI